MTKVSINVVQNAKSVSDIHSKSQRYEERCDACICVNQLEWSWKKPFFGWKVDMRNQCLKSVHMISKWMCKKFPWGIYYVSQYFISQRRYSSQNNIVVVAPYDLSVKFYVCKARQRGTIHTIMNAAGLTCYSPDLRFAFVSFRSCLFIIPPFSLPLIFHLPFPLLLFNVLSLRYLNICMSAYSVLKLPYHRNRFFAMNKRFFNRGHSVKVICQVIRTEKGNKLKVKGGT